MGESKVGIWVYLWGRNGWVFFSGFYGVMGIEKRVIIWGSKLFTTILFEICISTLHTRKMPQNTGFRQKNAPKHGVKTLKIQNQCIFSQKHATF